ncbi:hypothetical protein Glove_21g42 [Diversispora epigaea]|uniref:Uncharacterized protein n=1 Tax=Diversispora epigaea TaxID=1348612 RepID=A0A397JPU5_9GLOM|nr:hypothetical protein Glove_21g42 [Diversispora epigaea]
MIFERVLESRSFEDKEINELLIIDRARLHDKFYNLVSEYIKLEKEINELKNENIKIKTENTKLKHDKEEEKCILISQVLLGEKLIIKYRPPFLNGLELDAFFQKCQSWCKDVKKLEDVANRDRKKRCICQDNRIFLLEVWYDEKPEIVIPERIQKIKGFVNQVFKIFNL